MNKPILLLATGNKEKLREVKEAFGDLPFTIATLNDQHIKLKVSENGHSYEENAAKKAIQYGTVSGLPTLADDSGLEVEALDWKPGIMSKRYGRGSDTDRNTKLLQELMNVPNSRRSARYVCVIAFYDPQKKTTAFFKGVCHGIITESPKGKNGFGYDPIFYVPKIHKTFAQISIKQKKRYSHRGKALRKTFLFLTRYT